jgi:fibronectin-binding autotransporter adhesin
MNTCFNVSNPRARGGHLSSKLSMGRRRSILAAVIAPASFLVLCALPSAWGAAVFMPGDQILGGQFNPSLNQFQIGTGNGTVGTNSWPNGESPDHAIDGVAQKYLNFGITGTGFMVNPAFNGFAGSVVTSMQLWVANDAVPRDPASYEIWGTNQVLDFGAPSFDMGLFTPVASGTLALPSARGPQQGTAPLNNAVSQTVTFANTAAYNHYLIIFPTVKNTPTAANSMQIGEVQLFGVAAFVSLTWTGVTNNVWNINTTANWSGPGGSATYFDGNGVTFNDTGAPANTNITVQSGGVGVAPAAVTFLNNALDYTVGGDAVVSTGTFAKTGTGTVTLNNTNTYGSGMSVNAGTLNVGATGSLGGSALAVNNPNTGPGTAVAVNFASAQSIGSLSGSVALPSSGTNTAMINVTGSLTVNQTTDAVFQGTIAGTGGLTKTGSAMLTLTGVNTYAGPTIVDGGVLQSSAPGDFPHGALPAGQPVTVNAGGTLLFGADDGLGYHEGAVSSLTVNGGKVTSSAGTHSTLPVVTLNGGSVTSGGLANTSPLGQVNYILDGDVTTVPNAVPSTISAPSIALRKDPTNTGTTSPLTFQVPRGTAPVDLAVSSVIHDLGAGLIKSGNGILSLSNANLYTGPTVINEGKLLVRNSQALGSGPVTVNAGGTLSFGASTAINGFSAFTFNGGATADPTNSTVSLTENLGNQTRSVFSNTPLTIADGFTASFTYTAGGNRAADGITFTVQNNSPSALGTGGGGLGYGGIGNSAALEFNLYTGANPAQPVGTAFATNGITGTYTSSAPVNLASGNPIFVNVVYDPVAFTFTHTLVDQLTQATYTQVSTGVDIAAVIGSTSGYIGFTGATGGAIASQTVGNFTFDNFEPAVTLANQVTVNAGVSTFEVLPKGGGGVGTASLNSLNVSANGILTVTGGPTATETPYTLNVNGQTTIAGAVEFRVENNGGGLGSLVLGNVQGTATELTKSGFGILTITGNAAYPGGTDVDDGALLVNGTLSGSAIAVKNAAFLGGIGTVGNVSVATGGMIAPGIDISASIGTLRTGPVVLSAGSIVSMDIGATTSDVLQMTGGATFSGVVDLTLSLTDDPTENVAFTILDGTAPLGGLGGGGFSYLGLPLGEGATFTVVSGLFSQAFQISYAADSGRDVVLTAVPEPGAATALLVGGAMLVGFRRRRD